MNKYLILIIGFYLLVVSTLVVSKENQTTVISPPDKTNKEAKSRLGIKYTVSFDFNTFELNTLEFNKNSHNKRKKLVDKEAISSLEKLFTAISETHRLEDKLPLSLLILHRRAKSDLTSFEKALRSRGYYHSSITYKIENSQIKTEGSAVEVKFMISTGKAYLFDQITIQLVKGAQPNPLLKLPTATEIGLIHTSTINQVADARVVRDAEKKLINLLKMQSFAGAQIATKKFSVDHKKQTMDIIYEIDSGPSILMGDTVFKGLESDESVDLDFLNKQLAWKKGDLYHPDLITKTTQNMVKSDLFSTIRIELDKKMLTEHTIQPNIQASIQTNIQKIVPLTVHLKQSLHRSVKTSLGFDTDSGMTIGAKWTHQNYFGSGEKLSVEAAWTGVGPLLDINFRKPYFYHPKQSFFSNLKLQNEDTDAYESSSFNMAVGVDRKLIPGVTDEQGMILSMGLAFRYSQITDKSTLDSDKNTTNSGLNRAIDPSQNFSLLYAPVKLSWDFSNDLFEPDKGGKLLLQASPYMEIQSDLNFAKFFASYVHYLKLRSQPRFIIAGRLAIGQIIGAQSYELPADERLYAGGGGSVRGYGYQLIGPIDSSNHPLGGNSLLELAIESRLNFTQTMGGVVFIDAGSAFSESFFDGSSELLYGAGIGFRYASPMGPLRADIAIPVNPREGVDDSFQIYLSIGQAF